MNPRPLLSWAWASCSVPGNFGSHGSRENHARIHTTMGPDGAWAEPSKGECQICPLPSGGAQRCQRFPYTRSSAMESGYHWKSDKGGKEVSFIEHLLFAGPFPCHLHGPRVRQLLGFTFYSWRNWESMRFGYYLCDSKKGEGYLV